MDSIQNGNGSPTEHFLEILRGLQTAMLITRSPDGTLHGRPMGVADATNDGALWFITKIDSPKVEELLDDPWAMVTAQTSSQFATVLGSVEIVRDARKLEEIWKETYKVWFDGKDDPEIVLLRFSPEQGEYWDNSGKRGVKYAFRAVAAYIQGEKIDPSRDEPDTHAKVRL
jgi:general stress protein 26